VQKSVLDVILHLSALSLNLNFEVRFLTRDCCFDVAVVGGCCWWLLLVAVVGGCCWWLLLVAVVLTRQKTHLKIKV